MKISFKLLDQVRVEVECDRSEGGGWELRGMFPKFLERPGEPHLSLFATPLNGFYLPHFTARRGRFRRTLARVAPAALAKFDEQVNVQLRERWLESVKPVTVDVLEREGWTVHFVDWRAMMKWLKPHCVPGAVLLINDEIAHAIAMHVCRHRAAPKQILTVTEPAAFPILRMAGDSVELRSIFHLPEGAPRPTPDGRMTMLHPPGWYWLPRDWDVQDVAVRVLPVSKLERLVGRIRRYLERLPRRTPSDPREALPRFVAQLLGFYGADLIRLAIGLTLQQAERAEGDTRTPAA